MSVNDTGSLGKELKRKAFHLLSLAYLAAYHALGMPLYVYVMGAWTASIAAIETLRLQTAWGHAVGERLFGPIMRGAEARRYTGLLYTSLGALATVMLFGHRPRLVTAALLYLALADAAAAVVGKAWGRRFYTVMGSRRTWEGSCAGFLTALACGWLAGLSIPAIAVGAAIFLVLDMAPLPPNDNLWIPVLTACGLSLVA